MQGPTLLSLFLAFALLGVLFGLLERLFRSVPGPSWWRRSGVRTDLVYWFAGPLVSRTITGLALALVVVLLATATGTSLAALQEAVAAGRFPDLSLFGLAAGVRALPFAVQLLLGLVVLDLIGYWTHRAFHARTLWPFHAVHHSSTRLDWLASARVHPVNELLSRTVSAVPLLLLGFDPLVFALAAPITTLYAILLHANVGWSFGPLRFAIASPRFHRWHHTCEADGLDKNFAGLFPVWDLLFGTFHMPRNRAPKRFGVTGAPVPSGYLGQMAHPFRCARVRAVRESPHGAS